MAIEITFVGETRDRLGESPVWDPQRQILYWVDSIAPCIHGYEPRSGALHRWDMPDLIGSIGLAAPGSLLIALRGGFQRFDLATGTFEPIASIDLPDASIRCNDGKMDRQGRFLCGTMHMAHAGPMTDPPGGRLYRLDRDGSCHMIETGIGVSNALCFSPAGTTMYFADSLLGKIWAYDYDVADGSVSGRRVFADTLAMTGSGPDGATVDAEGHVWVALVRIGALGRFAPDGTLTQRIELPIPYPTCPAFGGPDLDILFCTAISSSGGRLSTDHPDGGRLMRITFSGAKGLPEARFGGV